jgi:hypothetical protein
MAEGGGMTASHKLGARILAATLLLLVACAKSSSFTDYPEIQNSPLSFDTSVPTDQALQLAKDFDKIPNFKVQASGLDESDPTGLDFDFNAPNASSLQTWLEDRVQYVVGEDFDPNAHGRYVNSSWSYDFANELPDLDQGAGFGELASGSGAQVVMENMGTAMYYKGKLEKKLIALDLGRLGTIEIRSPRTGILRIGAGLFDPQIAGYLGGTGSDAASIVRLATLFHEARHSDGHGRSLGFFHVKCPAGHDYEGYYACDRMLNGPYAVGASAMKTLLSSCENCSTSELEILKQVYADSLDRILTDYIPAADEKKIRKLEAEKDQQDYIASTSDSAEARAMARSRINEIDKQIDAIKEGDKATSWNDAPEGQR